MVENPWESYITSGRVRCHREGRVEGGFMQVIVTSIWTCVLLAVTEGRSFGEGDNP